jgi:hypothetical protein
VGAIIIKAIYEIAGLHVKYFQYFQLILHIINCSLLYLISKKYIGRFAALLSGILAGTWIAANTAVFWTAAIFDLFGATLCLLSILIWQKSCCDKRNVMWSVLGAIIYFLAIRTKEFTIGLPVFLFFTSVILEKKKILETIKLLTPYFAIMLILSGLYLKLLFSSSALLGNKNEIYGLFFSEIFNACAFYFSKIFDSNSISSIKIISKISVFTLAGFLSLSYRKTLFIGLSGFFIMLGPTLLLANHLDPLYLYAPHFFMAFAIGGLCTINFFWELITILLSISLVFISLNSKHYTNQINFYDTKTALFRDQFNWFRNNFEEIIMNSTIFISGLEPYFNSFSYGPGYSLKIAYKDKNLKVVLEKPKETLQAEFCKAPSPKYFITFDGSKAIDNTKLILDSCLHERFKQK